MLMKQSGLLKLLCGYNNMSTTLMSSRSYIYTKGNKMKTYINLTPHAIALNNGAIFPPSGTVARVSASFSGFDENLVCSQAFGEVSGLPSPAPGTIYIVSGMVLAALAGSRNDVVAPATGHSDCIRNEVGHIISVPGFVV